MEKWRPSFDKAWSKQTLKQLRGSSVNFASVFLGSYERSTTLFSRNNFIVNKYCITDSTALLLSNYT